MQREKAKSLLLAKIKSEIDTLRAHTNQIVQKKVYMSDQETIGLRSIKTIRNDLVVPKSDGENNQMWVAFVDDMPEANWGHPCRYLFIDDSGNISEVESTSPPSQKNLFIFEEIK